MIPLLQFYKSQRSSGRDLVLATLVKVVGSHYRKPGARMLIAKNGRRSGVLSGGCLEDEVAAKAKTVFKTGKPVLLRYDLGVENEDLLGYGMGCEGIVTVFLEKINHTTSHVKKKFNPLDFIESCFEQDRPGIIRTILDEMRDDFGRHDFAPGDKTLPPIKSGKAENPPEAFIEKILPPIHLHVFGAGSDALSVLRLGRELGWRLTLWDNRRLYLENAATLFKEKKWLRFIHGSPEAVREWFKSSPFAACVVMTHHFEKDKKIVAEISRHPLRYVGLLGPAKRGKELIAGLKRPNRFFLKAVRSPAGLALGSESPEEIALSIFSEIQSVFFGPPAGVRPLNKSA